MLVGYLVIRFIKNVGRLFTGLDNACSNSGPEQQLYEDLLHIFPNYTYCSLFFALLK